MKHSIKLGLKDNCNPENATKFARMLERHVKDPSTTLIKGHTDEATC